MCSAHSDRCSATSGKPNKPRRLRLDPVLALAILVAAVGAGLACGWGAAWLTDCSNINDLPHRIEADRSAATAPQQEEAGTGVGYNPPDGPALQGAGVPQVPPQILKPLHPLV